MKIALDARTIYRPQRRGIGRSLLAMYRALAAVRPDWRITAFHQTRGAIAELFSPDILAASRIDMPGDRFDAWERFRLPLAARSAGAHVLHCPANTCARWKLTPTVVTVHDLIPLDMPKLYERDRVARFHRGVQQACRRADWLLTPSAYTRDRLVSQFGAAARRITINPWAPDPSLLPANEAPAGVLERFGVRGRCVIHLGARDRRKNTLRCLEAWSVLPNALKRETTLLVVGLDDATLRQLSGVVTQLNLDGSVRLCGFVSPQDIAALFHASEVLLYPSLAEGFGLPVLDAFATGTAVVCSGTTSLPEVAGDAAEYVDAGDAFDIAEGLRRVLDSDSLRAELVQRGSDRVRQYTWEKTALRFALSVERALDPAEPRVRPRAPQTSVADRLPGRGTRASVPLRAAA